MELYIVRHGETDYNKKGFVISRTNAPLNRHGISQSKKTGKFLKDVKFDYIFSSPMVRALKTAEIIIKNNNFLKTKQKISELIKIDDRIKERDFGDFEFKRYDDLNLKKVYKNELYDEYHVESLKSLEDRTTSFLSENILIKKNNNKKILLVSHSSLIKTLLYYIISPDLEFWKFKMLFKLENCEIIKIDLEIKEDLTKDELKKLKSADKIEIKKYKLIRKHVCKC